MSEERDTILDRIREALREPAPVPGMHDSPQCVSAVSEEEASKHISDWLPAVGPTQEDRLKRFQKNSEDLNTDFRLLDSLQEVIDTLVEISSDWKTAATHRGELTDAVCEKLDTPLCVTTNGYDVTELESCDAGITECDALVAQTGSVLVTSRSAGGRALSVLPPHHVVLARRDQLLPDLPAAFAKLESLYADNYPSFISLITGPSRTGDIERILVLGAHGPMKLTVLCH